MSLGTKLSWGRIGTVLGQLGRDLRGTFGLAADMRSRLRLGLDFALSRLLWLLPRNAHNRLRKVRLRNDVRIEYGLNKGDLHSIREIWLQEMYWLPFDVPQGVLLDLGANIGMASVWLAKRFSFAEVIAVEPDPRNAAIVRDNFKLNGITGHVVEAAVGPAEGTGKFEFSEVSNLGRLGHNGSLVLLTSVDAIIKKFTVNRFPLIKIDIEGGEEDLFDGPTDWLGRTDSIVIELHGTADCSRILELMASKGFQYVPAHSLPGDNLPCFFRKESCAFTTQPRA
jgi:FkbM family methyltransferase